MIDPNDPPESLLLRGAAAVFAGGLAIRRELYRAGLVPVGRVSRPVISVGNLAVGGTGKTPFVIFLLEQVLPRGLQVAVLSRGYGASDPPEAARPLVVSRRGVLAEVGPERCGDEPLLIARKTRASVVVGADRTASAKLAIEELGAQLLLLDDGFQHWRLARDLDLVVLDAVRPLGNGRLLPAGPLREPVEALARAQLLVLNRAPGSAPSLAGDTLPPIPRVEVEAIATSIQRVGTQEAADPARLVGRPVALLAAIARPARFEATVAALGARIVHRLWLPDHAELDAATLARFASESAARGAELLLTTEKDAVRIVGEPAPPLWALGISHRLVSGREALTQILEPIVARAACL